MFARNAEPSFVPTEVEPNTYTNLINERDALSEKLRAVEAAFAARLPYVQFIRKIQQLESYLQRPISPSAYSIYESAISELSKERAQLELARADTSLTNRIIRFCFFPNYIHDLEIRIARRAQMVENLRSKLQLVGKLTLTEEYERLDSHLDGLLEKGFNPQLTLSQHGELVEQKQFLNNRISRINEIIKQLEAARTRAFRVNSSREWTGKKNESTQAAKPAKIDRYGKAEKPAKVDRPTRPEFKKNRKTVFTDQNFWSELSQDLKSAKKRVLIVSPYLTVVRSNCYTAILKELIDRKVRICVVTCPPDQHDGNMRSQSLSVIQTLSELNVEVMTVPHIHQKVILIDASISWEGSMNWLSHRKTAEHMRRVDDPQMVAEVKEIFDLYLDSKALFSCRPTEIEPQSIEPTLESVQASSQPMESTPESVEKLPPPMELVSPLCSPQSADKPDRVSEGGLSISIMPEFVNIAH